jgi:hypothetical protein
VQFDGARPKHVRGGLDERLEPHVYHALHGRARLRRHESVSGVLIGLSGCIDSALTLAVRRRCAGTRAVRALIAALRFITRRSVWTTPRDGRHCRRVATTSSDRARFPTRTTKRSPHEFAGRPVMPAEENARRDPRHATDGTLEQVRLDTCLRPQQVRDGGRLRKRSTATWRRLRGSKDFSKTLVYPTGPLSQPAGTRDS